MNQPYIFFQLTLEKMPQKCEKSIFRAFCMHILLCPCMIYALYALKMHIQLVYDSKVKIQAQNFFEVCKFFNKSASNVKKPRKICVFLHILCCKCLNYALYSLKMHMIIVDI